MSSDRLVLRGEAAVAARPIRFGGELSPSQVLATGPWAESYAEVEADARRAGYDDGLIQGRLRGAAQARDEVAAGAARALGALDDAAARLSRLEAATAEELAPTVVELALELAALVLQREVATCAEPARDALRRALAEVPDRGKLVVRLHPEDQRSLGPDDELVGGRDVTVLADPAVAPGDAVVDVGPCRVESRLGEALARVARALRGQEAA